MSRIVYSQSFGQQVLLVNKVYQKNLEDGASSIIKDLLDERKIDLEADVAAGVTARQFDTAYTLRQEQSEQFKRSRDFNFDLVMNSFRGMGQFLKARYSPEFRKLADWYLKIDGKGRLVYPAAFTERKVMFENFIKVHKSYTAGTSPLQPYINEQGIDVKNLEDRCAEAFDDHLKMQDAKGKAEIAILERNKIWLPVMEHMRLIGNFLMKLFGPNARKANAWGFVVDDSARPPKERTTKMKPGTKITTTGVVIGSTFTNVSETDLHVYAGRTTTGNPNIVKSKEMLGMLKGYSVITVVNPSPLVPGKFKVLVSK